MPKGTELELGYWSAGKAGLMLGLVPVNGRLTCQRLHGGLPPGLHSLPAVHGVPAGRPPAGSATQSPSTAPSTAG